MPRNSARLKHFDILAARAAYEAGENVTRFLRLQHGETTNTPEIIEAAYDLQAGTYVAEVLRNPGFASRYCGELAEMLQPHLDGTDSLLDVGTGEMTTLTGVLNALRTPPESVLAFDISWSRIHTGLAFMRENLGLNRKAPQAFVGDIAEIPLRNRSVDIVTSSHALEPNGGRLRQLLSELFRIARRKLVLFEPSYELNSPEGKARMDHHGYVRDIVATAKSLGAGRIETVLLRNLDNPLNPTACFVIEVPGDEHNRAREPDVVFSVPGSDLPLALDDGFYFSRDTGLSFPIIRSIPILRSSAAILTTALPRE